MTPTFTSSDRPRVIAAGDMLRGKIYEPITPDVLAAFATANRWREFHSEPLREALKDLRRAGRTHGSAIVVAGRVKRLSSVRKKLTRTKLKLWDIQDLAGIRAICPSMFEVEALVADYHDGDLRHLVSRENDLIASPRPTGYRSRHLILKANSKTGRPYDGRFVELQLRTQLQHSWATAVEAAGLMLGQDLKAGEGDARWLRLFALMSSEIADLEGQPLTPGTPADRGARRSELADIESDLGAVLALESWNRAIEHIPTFTAGEGRWIVRFDRASQTVTVKRYDSVGWDNRPGEAEDTGEALVVHVDGVLDLKRAYPNYFLDVGEFCRLLRSALGIVETRPVKPLPVERTSPLAWLLDYDELRRRRRRP